VRPSTVAACVTLATIALWSGLAAVVNPAQFADSIEQFNWAHSLEWGYWKHPPLPTWLMAGWGALLDHSPYASYSLAALCFALAAFFTWRIADRMFGAPTAAIAIVLWGLHLGFSWRAQVYNHNTVLVMVVAATVWAAMRAAQSERPADWLLTGLFGGAALLTKYQAAVPLAGIAYALWRNGDLRSASNRRGAAGAVFVSVACFVPHALWSLANDLPGYRYFAESAASLDPKGRAFRFVTFLANQLRYHLPMLGAIGLALLWPRPVAPVEPTEEAGAAHREWVKNWLWGLIGIPVIALLVMLLLGGLRLQAQWGLQALQFLCLPIAWKLGGHSRQLRLRALVASALAIHAGSAFLYTNNISKAVAVQAHRSPDRIYPANELALQALASWRAVTTCPLKYVAGPGFEAGLVSVYSGAYPQVREEGARMKSPWIDEADFLRSGAIVLAQGPQLAGVDDAPSGGTMRVPGKEELSRPRQISWRIQAPAEDCARSEFAARR
jgi:4-amino-4-deoxy-L-arabinose transferase-like glycosyltransferase